MIYMNSHFCYSCQTVALEKWCPNPLRFFLHKSFIILLKINKLIKMSIEHLYLWTWENADYSINGDLVHPVASSLMWYRTHLYPFWFSSACEIYGTTIEHWSRYHICTYNSCSNGNFICKSITLTVPFYTFFFFL